MPGDCLRFGGEPYQHQRAASPRLGRAEGEEEKKQVLMRSLCICPLRSAFDWCSHTQSTLILLCYIHQEALHMHCFKQLWFTHCLEFSTETPSGPPLGQVVSSVTDWLLDSYLICIFFQGPLHFIWDSNSVGFGGGEGDVLIRGSHRMLVRNECLERWFEDHQRKKMRF